MYFLKKQLSVVFALFLAAQISNATSLACNKVFIEHDLKVSQSIFNKLSNTFSAIAENVQIHSSGESGFLKKLEIIENAEPGSVISLKYFILENDFSSSYLIKKLHEVSVKKNIKVRILVDYVMSERGQSFLETLVKEYGFEVKRFRPETLEFRDFVTNKLQVQNSEDFFKGLKFQDQALIFSSLKTSPVIQQMLIQSVGIVKLYKTVQSGKDLDLNMLMILMNEASKLDPAIGAEFKYHLVEFTKRMHHKLMFNSQSAIIGGRNISDEYHLSLGNPFLKNRNYPFFDAEASFDLAPKDIAALEVAYSKMWESSLSISVKPASTVDHAKIDYAKEIENLESRASEFAKTLNEISKMTKGGRIDLGSRTIKYIENGPESSLSTKQITKAWVDQIQNSTGDVEIISAYFFFTPELYQVVKKAVKQGRKVIVRTNSFTSTDMNIVNINAYQEYPKWKADLGDNFKLFELLKGPKEGSLHAKIMETFGLISIGSANSDTRTHLHDTNNMVVIDVTSHPEIAKSFFDQYRNGGYHKLSWEELTVEKANYILQEAIKKQPALKYLIDIRAFEEQM